MLGDIASCIAWTASKSVDLARLTPSTVRPSASRAYTAGFMNGSLMRLSALRGASPISQVHRMPGRQRGRSRGAPRGAGRGRGARQAQPRRGSQLKNRMATSSPAAPQAATTRTSVQLKAVPMKPACMLRTKWRTGNIRASQRIHDGVLSSNGMKIPDRNSTGRMTALTTAAAASPLGMAALSARPSAQNVAEPTSTATTTRSRVVPVGTDAW